MLSDKNKIKEVIGRKVYNSQGFATIEVEITLENGLKAWASAPRGSTKGNFETTYVESYINGIERTPNIDTAIANINNIVAPALKGKCFKSIEEFDKVLVSLDKTDRKKIIGGNCTLAASYAMLKLLSLIEKKPIYKLFNNISDSEVLPIFNMIDGSKHPKSCLNGVEILLIPKKDKWHNNITKLFDAVSLINSTLKELLIEENYIVEVSNQGALSILEDNMEKCLEYLKLALEKEGYSVEVIDMFTIKPLDEKLLIKEAKGKSKIVTIENHSIYGGLGSAVSEVIAENGISVPVKRIGVKEKFGQVGTAEFLQEEFGLTAKQIKETICQF